MKKTFALAVFAWLSLSVLCGAVILYGSHAAVPVSKAYSTVSSGYSSSYSSGSSTSQPSSSKQSATVGEQNALKSAKRYLNSMPFSKKGLIDQLEYEGYTHDQAVYGVTQNGY